MPTLSEDVSAVVHALEAAAGLIPADVEKPVVDTAIQNAEGLVQRVADAEAGKLGLNPDEIAVLNEGLQWVAAQAQAVADAKIKAVHSLQAKLPAAA